MQEEQENPWKVQRAKELYDNPWITVTEYGVITPTGSEGIYGKVHFKNRALAIVPVDDEGNTWLVGQYRFTLDEYSWEVPMGGGPLGEEPVLGAQRELKEETGLVASDWQNLGRVHTSNSVTDEEGYSFLARGLKQEATAWDDTEDLQIRKLPLSEAIAMCRDGRITDCMSIVALLQAAEYIAKEEQS